MIARVGKECCGCAACANICPKNCIRMNLNNEGFLYPHIQEEDCVKCGMCEKVCPILAERLLVEKDKRQAWAVVNRDQKILMDSSSGGLFTALADTVIDAGGCVFGVAFTTDFSSTHHIMVEKSEILCLLRGSKYMQSDLEDCYSVIRKELRRGRWVLFTGTPCQAAALKGFLDKDYNKLICVDVICHGTPSSMLWQHYLKNLEERLGGKATAVSFRDKTYGWKKYSMNITVEGKGVYHCPMHKDAYMRLFLKNVCLRESCYHCRVKEKGFFSDITIGDLWGVEQILPETDSSRGVSLAIVHTEKGNVFFEQAGSRMDVIDVDYKKAVSHNPSLTNSVKRPPERDRFFYDLEKLSWSKLEKRYLEDRLSTRVRRKISASPVGAVKRIIFRERLRKKNNGKL